MLYILKSRCFSTKFHHFYGQQEANCPNRTKTLIIKQVSKNNSCTKIANFGNP